MKRNRIRALGAGIAVSFLAVFTLGATAAQAEEGLHCIYISPAAANSYWVDLASGITRAADELGMTIDMLGPDQVDQIGDSYRSGTRFL